MVTRGPSGKFYFTLLGPLSVWEDDNIITVAGVHQRAVLGYLLLHDNDVVPTSRLLKILWNDDPPRTARKMLQNAISGLRSALTPQGDSQAPILLTCAPGYLLQVEDQCIDRHAFTALADNGRALLQAGKQAQAADTLRTALDMWRGDALADLVELGFRWPELDVLRESRLTALENRFVADIACGRHHEIIGELEMTVAAEPTREQLCGLLMLATYRAGRQGDALAAYRRLRAQLVDELGTEPGESLRTLERDILNHAPRLGTPTAADRQVAASGQVRAPRWPGPALRVAPEPAPGPVRGPARVPAREAIGRRSLTVALFIASQHDSAVGELVNEYVHRHGGVVTSGPGSSWCGYFGATHAVPDHAERALAAARAITQVTMARFPGAGVRVAMHTGETVIVEAGDDPTAVPSVAPVVLDGCWRLATAAMPGHVVISAPSSGRLAPGTLARDEMPTVPFVGRAFEMELLQGLVRQVSGSGGPTIATLIGSPGVGKSRLATELAAQVRDSLSESVYLMRATVAAEGATLPVLAELIRDHLSLRSAVGLTEVDHRLAEEADLLPGTAGRGHAISSRLRAVLKNGSAAYQPEMINGCLAFLRELAAERPLLIIVDDVHQGGWDLLAALSDLAGSPHSAPVLVLATGRPEFAERLPGWAGTRPNSLNFVLGGLSTVAISRLLSAALTDRRRVLHFGRDSTEVFRADPGEASLSEARRRWHTVLAAIGGNPRRAMRYAAAFNAAPTDEAALTDADALLREYESADGEVAEDRFGEPALIAQTRTRDKVIC
jgi:DNA-binding SARP family transcriptional activator